MKNDGYRSKDKPAVVYIAKTSNQCRVVNAAEKALRGEASLDSALVDGTAILYADHLEVVKVLKATCERLNGELLKEKEQVALLQQRRKLEAEVAKGVWKTHEEQLQALEAENNRLRGALKEFEDTLKEISEDAHCGIASE